MLKSGERVGNSLVLAMMLLVVGSAFFLVSTLLETSSATTGASIVETSALSFCSEEYFGVCATTVLFYAAILGILFVQLTKREPQH